MSDELIRAQMAEIERLRAELERLKTTYSLSKPLEAKQPRRAASFTFDDADYGDRPQPTLKITESVLAQMRQPRRYSRNRTFGESVGEP
jgi:hypothetical protein